MAVPNLELPTVVDGLQLEGPTPINVDALKQLLRFVPVDVQKLIAESLPELMNLYIGDRLFLVEARLHKIMDALKAAETSLAAKFETSVAVSYDDGVAAEAGKSQLKVMPSVQGIRVLRAFINESKLATTAYTKADDCREVLKHCTEHTTWSKVRVDDQGHGTYYRSEPGMGSHSFKVVGVVKANLSELATVLLELDLFKEWFPFCNFSKELGSVSTFHKFSQFAIRLPWPLANREVVIQGYGIDDLENRRVVIRAVSIPDDDLLPDGRENPPALKGNVRCDLKVGGFLLEAVTSTESKLTFIMNIDPKIPAIPVSVINWVSGKMIWVLLYQIQKASELSKNPSSKYGQRRIQRKNVYDYFLRRSQFALADIGY